MHEKIILILHGWPQYRLESYFLTKHLKDKGYKIVYPDLFDQRFEFTLPNLLHKVNGMLNNVKPVAIVGISMGGLVLPYLGQQFPESKLIFIASGGNIKSKSKIFNLILKNANSKFSKIIFKLIYSLPERYFEKLYRLINPFKGKAASNEYEVYEKDTKENVAFIKSIPIEKELEIVNFVRNTDNRLLLQGLKNKALIFSGENDLMMPKEKGVELKNLLINSRLIVNQGEHFNVFSDKDLQIVEEFLLE